MDGCEKSPSSARTKTPETKSPRHSVTFVRLFRLLLLVFDGHAYRIRGADLTFLVFNGLRPFKKGASCEGPGMRRFYEQPQRQSQPIRHSRGRTEHKRGRTVLCERRIQSGSSISKFQRQSLLRFPNPRRDKNKQEGTAFPPPLRYCRLDLPQSII